MPSSIRKNFRQGNNYTEKQIQEAYQSRITTTSHYKMPCSCCGKFINRGDKITQVLGDEGSLKPRGNFLKHLNRKRVCKPYLNNISIESIRKEFITIDPKMTPTDSKMTPTDPGLTPTVSTNDSDILIIL